MLALLLVLSFALSGWGTLRAEAASNKALRFSYSFNGKSGEDGAEKWLYNNNHTIEVSGAAKQTAMKNLTISTDFYIPKSVLSKKGSKITISPCLQLFNTKGKHIGDRFVRMHVTAENVKGKVKLTAWDALKEKDISASKYASIKAGTGKYKSYYVLKLKKIPFMSSYDSVSGKSVKLKSSSKYKFNVGFEIIAANSKSSGKMYIDNVKVLSGTKKIVNQTFSSKPEYYGGYYKNKKMSSKKIAIVNF